jgi:hypothetical protein
MEDLKGWLIKIILPALVAISMKLAVQYRLGISWFNVISSFVTGIGSAYLFGPAIISYVPDHWHAATIAVLAMSGEKIGLWLVYRLKVEDVLGSFFDKITKK